MEPNNNNQEIYLVKSPSNAYQTTSIPQTTYQTTYHQQLPQTNLPQEDIHSINTPHITYTDTFSSQTYFDPNEIFQLNNPIKSFTDYTSPQSYHRTTQSCKSISPPTVLDMESGTIHQNHHSSVAPHMPSLNPNSTQYDYNSNSCDDAASLVSSSSAFDDGYYSVQGHDFNQYSPSYSEQQYGGANGEMNALIDYYVNDGIATQSQDYDMCVYPILGGQHSGSEEFINYDPTLSGFY